MDPLTMMAISGALQGVTALASDIFGPSAEEQAAQRAREMEQANRATMTNAAGFTGEAAAADAQNALRKYENTQSAESIAAQNRMRSLGEQALSAAQGQADTLTRQNAMQQGNLRRDLVNASRMAGGSPAGIMGAIRAFGDQSTQGQVSLAAQLGQNAMTGIGTALGAQRSADQSRIADMSNRMTMAAPHLVQYTGTGAGAMGALASAGAQNQQTAQSSNPLSFLSSMAGYGAGRSEGKFFDDLFGYQTNPKTTT